MPADILPSVLIVDDNDLMRTLLRGILRGEKYQVIGEARNGQQALDSLRRLSPDIVCLDIVMPEMSGLEALQMIKEVRPETVVVMITASPSVENVQESIQKGAAGFIVKPFNSAKVLNTLNRAWSAVSTDRGVSRQSPPQNQSPSNSDRGE